VLGFVDNYRSRRDGGKDGRVHETLGGAEEKKEATSGKEREYLKLIP